jgi:hypothetical protein
MHASNRVGACRRLKEYGALFWKLFSLFKKSAFDHNPAAKVRFFTEPEIEQLGRNNSPQSFSPSSLRVLMVKEIWSGALYMVSADKRCWVSHRTLNPTYKNLCDLCVLCGEKILLFPISALHVVRGENIFLYIFNLSSAIIQK